MDTTTTKTKPKRRHCPACRKRLTNPRLKTCGKSCRKLLTLRSRERQCEQCGSTFHGDKGRRFCSHNCSYDHRVQSSIEKRSKGCLECGGQFVADRPRNQFCSRECSAANVGRRLTITKACIVCEKPIIGERNTCSDDCLHSFQRSQRVPREGRDYCTLNNCKHCGVLTVRRCYCSTSCNDKFNKRIRRRRIAKARVETVRRKDVFERDNHQCKYCGVALVIPFEPGNPASGTTDHVVPLSQDGEHSMANLVACCLRCNSTKGHGPPPTAHTAGPNCSPWPIEDRRSHP